MDKDPVGRKIGGGRLALFLVLAIALLVIVWRFDLQELLRRGLDWVAGLGPWGPVAFGLIYVVAAVLMIPGSILTLGAGVLFGVVRGAVVVLLSATLGATAAFLIGRYVARDWVAHRIEGSARFKSIDEAVGREGWKIVGLARLSPVFPFNVLNYAFGITRVSLKHYVLASLVGMIPGTIMYVYIGSLVGDLAKLWTGERTRTPGEFAFYALGLVATIVVTVLVTRTARQTLNQKLKEPER